MENSNNKKLYIICGTIVACVAILCITLGVIITSTSNNNATNQTVQTQSSSSKNTESDSTSNKSSTNTDSNKSTNETTAGYQNVIDSVKSGSAKIAPTTESSGKTLTVAYKDINADNVEEMFLGYDNVWWAAYTLQNNSATKIVKKESTRDSLTLRDDNTILRVKVSSDGENTEHNVFSFPTSIKISGRVGDDTGDGATLLFHAEKSHDRDDWYAEYEIGVGAADHDCNQADYEAYLTQMNVNAGATALNWSNVA